MRKGILGLLITLLLCGCSLNAEQEKNLNGALSSYLSARNECRVLSYVAFTLPEVVRAYKEKGDSVFKSRFDCAMDTLVYFDPTIREVKRRDQRIDALIELKINHKYMLSEVSGEHKLVAVSRDDGKNWFFLDHSDYVDNSLISNLDRLLSN